MWLILVDRSASALDAVKGELARRLGASDTVAFFGAAHEITHSFDDGPTAGPADVGAALRWATATLAGESRVLLVSDLRNTPFDDDLAAAVSAIRERCPVDVLLLEAPGYGYWVAERIANGRVVTASSMLELGKAMATLLDPSLDPTADAATASAFRARMAAPSPPMPTQAMPRSPEQGYGYQPPATGRGGRGFGAIGAGAAAAVGSAIGRLVRRRRTKGGAGRLEFTVAHPAEVVSGHWHTLIFVLYRSGLRDTVDAVLRSHAPDIDKVPARSSAAASAHVERGTVFTLVPEIPGVVCTPARADVTWHDDVQETTFTLCAEAGVGSTRIGSIEVYIGPLLLAIVPVALSVLSVGTQTHFAKLNSETSSTRQPRTTTSHARAVDRVFASYSRRDFWVVDACTAAYQALGVEVLIDRANLRSGEEWRASPHSLISASDLFQLYWSEASATSSEVESEWRFANSLTGKGSRFIRPLFWETPMPLPPVELSHLHFSRITLDQLSTLPGSRADHDRRP